MARVTLMPRVVGFSDAMWHRPHVDAVHRERTLTRPMNVFGFLIVVGSVSEIFAPA